MTDSRKAILLTYEQKQKRGYQLLVQKDLKAAKKSFEESLKALNQFISYLDEYYQSAYLPKIESLKNMLELINTELDKEETEESDDEKITFSPVTSNIRLDDVKGLAEVKSAVNSMVINPIRYKDIYRSFRRNGGGGILLFGVPGNGKTMIARAIASEVDAKFFAVSCSDIESKWHGESENNIKELFKEADKYDRSVIFFDEFETLGTSRDDDDNSVTKKIVSELLVQLQGFATQDKDKIRLVIAATNRPWDIDTALTRPGRISTKICVGLPDYESRLSIIESNFADIPTENSLDFGKIAVASEGYSGADVVDLCNKIKDSAIGRSIRLGHVSPVNEDDVAEAKKTSRTSVSPCDLQRMREYQAGIE